MFGLGSIRAIAATLALAISLAASAQSSDQSVFREAFPQCFKLYAPESVEHRTCLEISARSASIQYTDEEIAGLVARQVAPPPVQPSQPSREVNIMREAFPQCFTLWPEPTLEQSVCLDVAAMTASTVYTDDQLKAAVIGEVNRRDAAKREGEQSRALQKRRELAQAKAAASRRDARQNDLARKPLGYHLDGWRLGGFGTVFLATITLQNNSSARMADFIIVCSTVGNSGTQLSKPSGVLYEALAPGQRKTSEVNLGITHSQSARASCSVKSGI